MHINRERSDGTAHLGIWNSPRARRRYGRRLLQNLREWIALLERKADELQHIKKSVDADEELSAITYMANTSEKCGAPPSRMWPAILSGARILASMLGSSRRRVALAVGLDPPLHIRDDSADPRNHEPAHPAAARALTRRRRTKSYCAAMASISRNSHS